jgi:putative component of toxin-antitoxin plasmid stabilization module
MRLEETDAHQNWMGGLKNQAGRARLPMCVDRLIFEYLGEHLHWAAWLE